MVARRLHLRQCMWITTNFYTRIGQSASNSFGFSKYDECYNRRGFKAIEGAVEGFLDSLQAEFVALRSDEKDEGMTAAADAKRMRTASNA